MKTALMQPDDTLHSAHTGIYHG